MSAAVALSAFSARADDTLKLAIGGFGFWSVEAPRVGQQAGIFKKHGIILELFPTAGAGETMQAVISGSADLGIGVGTSAVLGAFAKGAPVRIIGANFTGASDLYWYVKADSPIKSLKDLGPNNTLSFSTNGSSSHIVATALLRSVDSKAKPVAAGTQQGTLAQVMSGQIDVGWAGPPFGLQEIEDKKIRILATGADAIELRDQTVRVDIANLRVMKERKDVLERFQRAYRETLDWMYADPQAIDMWSKSIGVPRGLAQIASDKFQTKAARDYMKITGLDAIMDDAMQYKILPRKLTKQELDELIVLPAK